MGGGIGTYATAKTTGPILRDFLQNGPRYPKNVYSLWVPIRVIFHR